MSKKRTGIAIVAGALTLSMVVSLVSEALSARNGAPGDSHYTLSVVGVPKGKPIVDEEDVGPRIYVPLYSRSNIWLEAGDSFNVVDADGTSGNARLRLHDPSSGEEAVTYKIYMKALDKPGGIRRSKGSFADQDGVVWYPLKDITLNKDNGNPVFSDKTLELTVDCANTDGAVAPVRYNLFDYATYRYFWDYDSNGLKVLQLRMYVV